MTKKTDRIILTYYLGGISGGIIGATVAIKVILTLTFLELTLDYVLLIMLIVGISNFFCVLYLIEKFKLRKKCSKQ